MPRGRGTWTLKLAAQVGFEQGIIDVLVSTETIRRTLKRLKTNWKRAKHWITSPDPQYLLKKTARDRLIAWASQQPTWVIGFEDEVWWSRFALPCMHGKTRSIRCIWWNKPGKKMILIPKPWPVLESFGKKVPQIIRFVKRCPCASSREVLLVIERLSFWSGVALHYKNKAKTHGCSFGTMPLA